MRTLDYGQIMLGFGIVAVYLKQVMIPDHGEYLFCADKWRTTFF